jgi:hypothetical protein
MRKVSKLLAAVFVTVLSISCEDTRGLDEKAIDTLKSIRKGSQEEYFANFITKEQLQLLDDATKDRLEIVPDENNESEIIAQMNSISSEELYSNRYDSYNKMKEDGVKELIDWENIVLVDIIIDKKEWFCNIDQSTIVPDFMSKPYNAPVYAVGGWLYWKYNERVYKSEVSAILILDKYLLYKLEDAYLQ